MVGGSRVRPGSGVFYLLWGHLVAFLLLPFLPGLVPWLAFIPKGFESGLVWTPLTAIFVHLDFFHFICNFIAIAMFAPEIEELFGRWSFLQFYFTTGIFGYLFHWILNLHSVTPVIGSSGADFALLLVYGWFFPARQVLLFFVLPVSMRQALAIFAIMELSGTLQRIPDGIAHLVHLGGFVGGSLYLYFQLYRFNFFGWFIALKEKWDRARAKSRFKVIRMEDYRDEKSEEREN